MLRNLNPSEEIKTTLFGDFCPYWTKIEEEVWIADTAEEIFLSLPEDRRVIDPVAVLELLQFNYMLGNRTLIQGVNRMPWRALLRGNGEIERFPPLPHDNNLVDPKISSRKLGALLEEELFKIARDRPRVYLLLSGGLDSRVIAGVLKKIENRLSTEIGCVTWGLPDSRDVVYARRIASWYDWDFFHIPYDSKLVWSNIEKAAIWGGSEVAGIHLHGAEWFKRVKSEDLVLTGSFGDSVGRAEFSGKHIKDLSLPPLSNIGGLLHPSLVENTLHFAELDRATAWEHDESQMDWVRNELSMHENYMRRMIVHAMNYIRQFCNLHHLFASESVVSYMWSLSPDCRTNEIYFELLKALDPQLYALPWARNGIAPNGSIEMDQSLRKNHHHWGSWLHSELRPKLESLVFSSGLNELGVFYAPAIRRLWNRFLTEPDDKYGIAENIVKLCSIELSRRHFGLVPCRRPTVMQDFILEMVKRPIRKAESLFRNLFEI